MQASKITVDVVDDLFEYHAPTDQQIEDLKAVRAGAKAFARIIIENTPGCADQSAAIRKLRETVTTANQAIIFNGRF